METCVRGFSYMPQNKVEPVSLQYLEDEELEKTWKVSRRERLKQREEKIWAEFVKEKDVLSSVCEDDPYQFLEQLPESCLKELMEIELQRMKKEKEEEHVEEPEIPLKEPEESFVTPPPEISVTFVEEKCEEEQPGFALFTDDNDDGDDPSGEEDAPLESASSPSTVREQAPVCKSSENITNMIENSIYCAKLKELQSRIYDEIQSIVETLECRDVQSIEPEDLPRMSRRAADFSGRFQRVHLYQLQRQIQDIKRNKSVSLPFARRTQLQALLLRDSSLQQNVLHALQVYHRGVRHSGCVRESAEAGRSLADVLRHAHAYGQVWQDNLVPMTERLVEAVDLCSQKMEAYIASLEPKSPRSKKSHKSGTKKKQRSWYKPPAKSIKSESECRLSMYSLDTRGRGSGGTSKGGASGRRGERAPPTAPPPAKPPKKSPRNRRPLMRGGRTKHQHQPDTEPRTLVEGLPPSSHMSREPSPHRPARRLPTPRPAASPTKSSTPKPLTALIQSAVQQTEATSPGHTARTPKPASVNNSPRVAEGWDQVGREQSKPASAAPARCEVTRIVRQLCGGDAGGYRGERVSGAKNAQLHCVSGSPRQPSTPQLLRILEETIQKKAPRAAGGRLRLVGAAPSAPAYRAARLRHMLASPLYSSPRPHPAPRPAWRRPARISESLIDELLMECVKDMQISELLQELYVAETR